MEKIKYPRTYHLPYSPSKTDDDKTLTSDNHFYDMNEVVVTIKMDGENTTVYNDGSIHARSLDGYGKPWQKIVKGIIQYWCYNIPDGWRVCGENLQAQHSIKYVFNSREEMFQCFGIYNEKNECLSWDDTEKFCEDNGIEHVYEIYRGPYNKDYILSLFNYYCDSLNIMGQEVEGFVVRNAAAFPYEEFKNNVGKYVRENHVQTDEHWTRNWKDNEIVK